MNAKTPIRLALAVCLAAAAAVAGTAQAQVRLDGAPGFASSVHVMSWRDIPFRTVVRQQYDFSCGSAALATLLTYQYGITTSEAQIFKAMYDSGDQAKIRRQGFSLLDMKRYLALRGVKADGFRLNLAQIDKQRMPAIALISVGRYRHFVVIKGISGGKVLTGDPALGLKIYTQAEFAKLWNGIAFVIDPLPTAPHGAFNLASDWSPWSRAPLHGSPGDGPLSDLSRNLAPIYQLTPVRNIPGPVAGGVP